MTSKCCARCALHAEHPELIGRALTPAEFAALHPQPAHQPTSYGPEVDAAIADALSEIDSADRAYAAAMRAHQDAVLTERAHRRKRPTTALMWLGLVDTASGVAQAALDEAAEDLRAARIRHGQLVASAERDRQVAVEQHRNEEQQAVRLARRLARQVAAGVVTK